jgi:putative hemolysin
MVDGAMRDRIDPLIGERAPWLFSGRAHHAALLGLLMRVLGYRHTLEVARALEHRDTAGILAHVAALVARDVRAEGVEHIPAAGPALIVANHPTGIADGIVLWSLVAPRRPDLYVYANRDILRVLPQMADLVVPVEWRPEKRTLARTRETMEITRAAIEAGRPGVIFPSGRLAQRRGLRLVERPWIASAAMLARRYALPVVPVHIRARNSALFYLFDLIHPTLRDITLFHETLNKHRQTFGVTVGAPIPGEDLPAASDAGIAVLRAATLALAGRGATRPPRPLPVPMPEPLRPA